MVYDIKALEGLAQKWVDKASAAYDRPFPKISVSLELKGTCAGKAYHWETRIKLNRFLLRQNPEDMVNQTLPHEIAHVITHIQYPFATRSHGPEWQSVMRMFGLDPDTCHSYDTSNVGTWKLKTFKYLCPCGPKNISAIRHKRALKNIREKAYSGYTCRKCKMFIVPASAGQKGVEEAVKKTAQSRASRKRLRAGIRDRQKAHDQFWGLGAPQNKTRKSRALVQPKTWAPKEGSKGGWALGLYRDVEFMSDTHIVAYLMKKMNIKKGNARQYLALCKKAA